MRVRLLLAVAFTVLSSGQRVALADDPPPSPPPPAPAPPVEETPRGFVGFTPWPAALTPAPARERFGITATKGAIVQAVVAGGPAEKAGLKVADVIVKYAGKDVPEVDVGPDATTEEKQAAVRSFREAFAKISSAVKVGDAVEIVVEREGGPVTLEAKAVDRATIESLQAPPAEPKPPEPPPEPKVEEPKAESRGFIGFAMAPVRLFPPEDREKLKISASKGVVAYQVVPDSPAAKAGLKNGDVVVRYATHEVPAFEDLDPEDPETAKAWEEALTKMIVGIKPGDEVEICVEREGKIVTLKATAVDQATIQKLRAAAPHEEDEDDEEGEGPEEPEGGKGDK
jgi:S1-C subfamily serine protease